MKKLLTTILSICLAVSITGCGGTTKRAVTPTTKPTATVSASATPVATITPTPSVTSTPTSTPIPVSNIDIDDEIDDEIDDADDETKDITVYVTNSGKKYHHAGCQYLANSKIAISLEDAIDEGYEPCSKCCY